MFYNVKCSVHIYLAAAIFGQKYIPCCQVSVDESLVGQVGHARGHLAAVTQEGVRHLRFYCLIGPENTLILHSQLGIRNLAIFVCNESVGPLARYSCAAMSHKCMTH